MGDELLSLEVAERVLQFHELDEEVVLRVEFRRAHRALEIEGQPLLDSLHPGPPGQVHEQDKVEDDGRGQDAVPAEEVDLDLHRVAHPAEDVDVVPALLVVPPGRVIIDPDLVGVFAVKVRVDPRLEDVLEDAQLALFLRLEGLGIVEDLAVAVAEDVGREPAVEAEEPRFESGGKDGLHQGLPGLEVLAGDGHRLFAGELPHGRDVHGQVRRAVSEWDA